MLGSKYQINDVQAYFFYFFILGGDFMNLKDTYFKPILPILKAPPPKKKIMKYFFPFNSNFDFLKL